MSPYWSHDWYPYVPLPFLASFDELVEGKEDHLLSLS